MLWGSSYNSIFEGLAASGNQTTPFEWRLVQLLKRLSGAKKFASNRQATNPFKWNIPKGILQEDGVMQFFFVIHNPCSVGNPTEISRTPLVESFPSERRNWSAGETPKSPKSSPALSRARAARHGST